MSMKKMYMLMLVAVFAFAFAGCNSKDGDKKEAAPAPAGDAAAPAGNTMEDLCAKFITETKAANNGNLPGEAQVKDGCMQADKVYAGNPKGKEAVAAMVEHIMKTCDGKTGQDWVKCYADDAMAAGEAASKAMMGK